MIRRMAYGLACLCGFDHLGRWLNRRRVLILCYHGVTDARVPPTLPQWHIITKSRLERQLAYVARHYDVRPIDDVLVDLAAGSICRPTACITFDDGYRNNATVALQVLRTLNMPASIYLTTGLIGTARRLWTVDLEAAIRSTAVRRLDLAPIEAESVELGDMRARVNLAQRLIRTLKKRRPAERDAIVVTLLERLAPPHSDVTGLFELMSWEETQRLEETGLIRFGAHTVNHAIVGYLDQDEVSHEIGASVAAVRQRIRRPSRTFAYPNGEIGDFDDRAKRAVREADCLGALTTMEGLNHPETDRFELRRITVGAELDFNTFRLSVSGWLPMLRNLFRSPISHERS